MMQLHICVLTLVTYLWIIPYMVSKVPYTVGNSDLVLNHERSNN